MDNILKSMHVAASGMKAQSDRLRIISENVANANATGQAPGDAPYRRKTISFKNHFDKEMGVDLVKVGREKVDHTPFRKKYDPSHPAADKQGYVAMPNVNSLIEMVDMKEARRSYEANINVIEISKSMLQQTISLLR